MEASSLGAALGQASQPMGSGREPRPGWDRQDRGVEEGPRDQDGDAGTDRQAGAQPGMHRSRWVRYRPLPQATRCVSGGS